jgi:hypothetical protein
MTHGSGSACGLQLEAHPGAVPLGPSSGYGFFYLSVESRGCGYLSGAWGACTWPHLTYLALSYVLG